MQNDDAGPSGTFFAPAGRVSFEELSRQINAVLEDPCVKVVLEAVDGFVLILNSQRQMVAANQELLDSLKRSEHECVTGLRVGEMMNCIHFTEGPDGCGTSVQCRTCGAAIALLASQAKGRTVTDECRLSVLRDGKLAALDLRVRATPLNLAGEDLTAFVLHDISPLKRREVLERTFLHDTLNLIGGLESWSSLLKDVDRETAVREILALSESLKEGVVSHRMLLAAEDGSLAISPRLCKPGEIMTYLHMIFRDHPVRKGKDFQTLNAPEDTFSADRALLLRVLNNMLQNAFEASQQGGTVRLSYERKDGRPTFLVSNEGVIPEDVRPHIFERSFTTKAAPGRGIGTYSMKLLGERYLGGRLTFTSDRANGTVFQISLPGSAEESTSGPARTESGPVDAKRILLVDDQEPLLRLGGLFLDRLGYASARFDDPLRALEEFRRAPESFEAVIVDWNMPGMNGVEFSRRISQIRPDIPILLATGMGEEVPPTTVHGHGIRHVLRKPFSLNGFVAALALVLGS